MTIFLCALCLVLIMCIVFLLVCTIRLSKFLFELEDDVEETLDILDERYRKINDTLQLYVISDDVHTRNVIHEIKLTREAILKIANKIISFSINARDRDKKEIV